MNDALYKFLDRFVVVYLNDIVVYSKTQNDHVQQLERVLERLQEHKLYTKKGKCEFYMREVMFLRHKISKRQIQMDECKIHAIVD